MRIEPEITPDEPGSGPTKPAGGQAPERSREIPVAAIIMIVAVIALAAYTVFAGK